MQVAAGQDGIQRLLAAEKEAQQIVTNARKGTLTFFLDITPEMIGKFTQGNSDDAVVPLQPSQIG